MAGWTILISGTYLAFLTGLWIPVVPPLLALTGSAVVIAGHKAEDLQRLASLDGLTQIANRRYFEESLSRQWYRRLGKQQYLSVILCDVDFFKFYNDTYGHQAGDKCLQQVAKVLQQSVRTNDLVARYGGEEFVVILPCANSETVIQIAQRISFNVKTLQIEHINSKASQYVTLSCGVASIIPNEQLSPSALVVNADKGLYHAKEQGRDRAILEKIS